MIGTLILSSCYIPLVESHKSLVRSFMTSRNDSYLKIKHEWDINKQFRGYAGVMDDRLAS